MLRQHIQISLSALYCICFLQGIIIGMFNQIPRFFGSNTNWLEKKQTTILSAAIIITLANIGSSLSGLVRQRLLIGYFFNTQESREAFEALLVAFQIPDFLFQLLILGALSAAFIPIFTSLKKIDEKEAFEMSATVINILLVSFILCSVLIFIFAQPLTEWRTGDAFTPSQVAIATNLTRIMLLAQIFFAVSSFFSAILQSFRRFIIPSIAPILYNIGIVLGVYLFSPWLGIYSAGAGVVLGAFMHMIIQLPLAIKLGFRFRWSWSLNTTGVKKLFGLMPARVLTIGVTEFQNLALGFFATSLGNLSFVVIRLATTLITIPIRLFGVPISQASLPFLSEQSEEQNVERFKKLVIQSLNQIAFFAFPASVLILILRIPIVRLAFGTHNFPWPTTVQTGLVVAIISLSITAQAMVQLLIRAFHAMKDTKTPLTITVAVVAFYLIGSTAIIYLTDLGIIGIAIITSVVACIELLLFVYALNRRIPAFNTKDFWLPQLKMVVASFLMAVSLYLPFRVLDVLVFNTTKTIELIALTTTTATIGMLVYLTFAVIFNIKELALITSVFGSFKLNDKNMKQTPEVVVETSVEDDTL